MNITAQQRQRTAPPRQHHVGMTAQTVILVSLLCVSFMCFMCQLYVFHFMCFMLYVFHCICVQVYVFHYYVLVHSLLVQFICLVCICWFIIADSNSLFAEFICFIFVCSLLFVSSLLLLIYYCYCWLSDRAHCKLGCATARGSRKRQKHPQCSTAIFVLGLFVLKIPGPRFRRRKTRNRSQHLQGPPSSLRFVQTPDRNCRNPE